MNPYAYCGSNPVIYVDQNGEVFMLVTGAVGAVIGGIGGAIYSYSQYGEVHWQNVAAGAAIGGAVGLTGGAAAAYVTTGMVTASTANVAAGAAVFTAKVGVVTGTIGRAAYGSWQKAEAAMRQTYGAVQKAFDTSLGKRVVDGFNAAKGAIHESKYGYQSLSSSIKSEIQKDLWLLQNNKDVKEVIWHFYRSEVSGTGGGSGPLIDALKEAGFKIMYH
jgi:hypothetical protein